MTGNNLAPWGYSPCYLCYLSNFNTYTVNVWTSIYILRMEGTGTPSCGAFPKGDQIGLRIWRAGKVDGRCINHVMVCFVFATLGDVAMMGKPCRGDHSQLATVQCLNPNGKKKQDFSHKTYLQEQNSQFWHQEASSCDVLFSHRSRNRTERCQKKAIVLE